MSCSTKVHIEKICDHVYLVRGGEGFEYGKPYDFVVSIVLREGVWTFEGMHGTFTIQSAAKLRKALREMGITTIKFDRKNHENNRKLTFEL